jgi:hypothetical protein
MYVDLARVVHGHDPVLAAELVASKGTTLEAQGIVPPAPPPPPPAPPPPAESIVDAVVCAAAEAMDLTPREVRAGLHAAFARARRRRRSDRSPSRALGAGLRKPDAPSATGQ